MPLRSEVSVVVAVLLLLSCIPLTVTGAELEFASVKRDARRFVIEFSMKLNVPIDAAREYVFDFENLQRFSPVTTESRLVTVKGEDEKLLRVVLKPCVLVFCRTLVKVSRIERERTDGPYVTTFSAIARLGSFHKARENIELSQLKEKSRFRYQAVLIPKFFVPPFVGEWLVRRTLVSDLLETAKAFEDDYRGLSASM